MTPETPPIVAEEERLLDHIRRYLLEHPEGSGASERELLSALRQLQAELVRAKTEDRGALHQQYEQLVHLLDQLRAGRPRREVDPDCPYFAHMRLLDRRGERDVFLGRATRIDGEVQIVDWRDAPVSGIFYRYQEGEDFEEQVGDVLLEGRLLVRRTLGISAGRLERVDSPQGSWVREGDRWLPLERHARLSGGAGSAFRAREPSQGAVLGTGRQHRADKRLPEIAALIDPEQFELITRPDSGVAVVRGGAGSGKTTVMLHRVAWLNYHAPDFYRPGRMLVLVWGRALERYVAHVLPSLGVEGVRVSTWNDWARRLVARHFPGLPREHRVNTPAALSRLKLHPGLLLELEDRVRARKAPRRGREALDDFLSLLADGPEVARRAAQRGPETLPSGLVERAGEQLRAQASELRAHLSGDRSLGAVLDPEDDALLLRAWQLRVGPLRVRGRSPLRYAHLAIDEVQDFSPVELRVALDCLHPRGSATLAGDTFQQIMEGGFTRWEDFFELAGIEGTVVETLQVSYRSTRAIASFARALLGPLDDGSPLRTVKEGPPVEFFRFSDHGACVAFLAEALRRLAREEPLANVALITPSPGLSQLYYKGLARAELPRLRRVVDQDFSFQPGVEITEVHEVKGLEFDYVVLVEASARHYPDTDRSRRLLHVGASRAIHQLWVTSVDTPARPLRELLREGRIEVSA